MASAMLFYQAALKKAADWALMFSPFLRCHGFSKIYFRA